MSGPRIGFIGLGLMGQPMARRLLDAGHSLVVWNRSVDKVEPLRAAGATVAASVADVFAQCDVVMAMLFDDAAIDQALARHTEAFGRMVKGRVLINMGTLAPEFSRALARDVEAAGGQFVEAPVSGSRVPAENGQLVVMLGGDREVCDRVRPLLTPLGREIVYCGPAGSALLMKLSVNIFMLVMATGLAEAVNFADRQGLDREQLQTVLEASPMASNFSRIKMAKLVAEDFSAQAAAFDAWTATGLIDDAAKASGAAVPLLGTCRGLFKALIDAGDRDRDMIAVIRAFAER